MISLYFFVIQEIEKNKSQGINILVNKSFRPNEGDIFTNPNTVI